MKNYLYLALILFCTTLVKAQYYSGYFYDNYSGVHGVLKNPSTIVDSRFRTDINIFSISTSLGNDLYGVNVFDLYSDSYNFEDDATISATENNNAIFNMDIMLPSVMFNIAPKHSMAVFIRSRTMANLVEVNGNLFSELKNDVGDDNLIVDIDENDFNAVANSWGEIGLSYAAVLLQSKQHFLKGGLTLKYLQGAVNSYANAEDLKVVYRENEINPGESTITTRGTVVYGGSQDFEADIEEFSFDTESKGFGFDLGLVYEWRPDHSDYDLSKARPSDNNFKDLNKYKLRFGISVIDIGTIKYNGADQDTYNIDNTITKDQFDSAENLSDLLNTYYTKIETTEVSEASLPTALHTDIDWNIHKNFYMNLNGDFGLVDKKKINGNSIENSYSLVPRYETQMFTFFIPISWMEYSGTQVGSGFRFGPLFIGSSTILTNLFSDESKATDFYMGFKLPLYHKKLADIDNDGVPDKDDTCIDIQGEIENNGCPWQDADKDGVLDKDDACINDVGPIENKGCPWPDTDKDGVLDKDDACIEVAGPFENKGCPWPDTDGDTVLDKDDACIDVPGLVENKGCPVLDADKDGIPDLEDNCPLVAGPKENKGCPKLTQETLERVRVEARSIFFETGKATLDAARYGQTSERLDAIKEILKNYPTAKWSINGYTDNTGNKTSNQKLSEARAKVVMEKLIEKGINPDNLTYKGWGDAKPVATNKTAEGRALNRRTEINYNGGIEGVEIPK